MTEGAKFFLRDDGTARTNMQQIMACVQRIFSLGLAARVVVTDLQPNRTLDQNSKMWPMLHDVSRQIKWHIDGKEEYLEAEEWKEIFTAGLRKTQRVAAGIEGGFVMLGSRTSRMTISEMSELVDFISWFGDERGVKWTEPKRK